MAAPSVLITGFGRFPAAPKNPSVPLARALAASRRPALAAMTRRADILVTSWAAAAAFGDTLARERPDIVLMIGLAARRRHICVETLALNRARAFPDALRRHAVGRRLDAGAPRAFACRAPAMPLLRALREAGLPARASRDAGGYICNALAFTAYRHAAQRGAPTLAVFVHVPLPGPHMKLAAMTKGLEALLVALGAAYRAECRAIPSR